ncbi:DUF4873 domain-containing protein [Mycobacterium szulgai]|nr:DUF4873 domain-containing protein [Mycobacterium szulgai]
MTQAPAHYHVVVVGHPAAGLPAAALVLPSDEVLGSVFDDSTDTWVLSTADQTVRAGVVLATDPAGYTPWIPELPGVFGGQSFAAAAWDADFDPAGKHIAVIGTDAAAAHYLGGLTESARSVTAFAHAPRRFITEIPLPSTRARRWLRRHTRRERAQPAVRRVNSAIQAVTSSGIRTSDGVEHRADVIIYGTGYAVGDSDWNLVGSRGVTIRQAWDDGMEPFFGVAVHGFPNYFFLTGPDFGTQASYIAECLQLMNHTASTRIEVRRSSQQLFNERAQLTPAAAPPVAAAFDMSSDAPDSAEGHCGYDGTATLDLGGVRHAVRVRLTGHLDPIDGNYHWQGTVFVRLPLESLKHGRAATLTVGEHSAPARIIEETPWGTHSVAGVGTPPYARSGR